ncbi:alpha/beta hydrolase-fold protein [Phenylobacterium sp.]|uniref:alpha/beta hydrolase n=1 Tax=Phenylobacterium sp. TaxID=1871053 RepID=UPI00286E503E|nr:alpha/beta hydrolase-fold protein [Phenylobacterium sp.]
MKLTRFLTAIACAVGFAWPVAAMQGRLVESQVTSAMVPGPVPISVYTPPGYDPKRPTPYPLLIQLHGGGGSNKNMTRMAELLDQAIVEGRIAPVVSVMPSAGRGFYMDFRDGSQKWETFVVRDLIAHMRRTTHVTPGREGTLVTGISMGGMGSLRMAFKHPEVFQAVAGMEPGIEPVLAFRDIQLRDRFWRSDALFQQIYGAPVDEAYWAANNPATIALKAPERLVGLSIYLEAGDQDLFFLHHGTEFLHRVLFDRGVAHEYRLVRGAEHVGASIAPRFLDAMTFLGRVLDPPKWIDAQVEATRSRMDEARKAAGYPITPVDPQRLRTR